jgi:hypothetical protein
MHHAFAAALAIVWIGASAASVPEGALAAATKYSSALNAHSCNTMLDLMSPSELRRIDRDPVGRSKLCELVAEFAAEGLHERLRAPTASVAHGSLRMVLFPNSRTAVSRVDGSPTITNGNYVVHSQDSGKTWKVIDLGCVNGESIRDVYPAYSGSPPITAATLEILHNKRDP